MKKLLGIVVLGLLWCNVGFALCAVESCPKPPKFSESSVRANVHKYGWEAVWVSPKKKFKSIKEKLIFERKNAKNKKLLQKLFNKKVMSYTDEYFISNSMKLDFVKIDPDTGLSDEWFLRCEVRKNKIYCHITGPKF